MSQTIFTKDLDNHKMQVIRSFAGTLQQVWQAWTDPAIMDQWWAPKPWKAVTKSMDFREGGSWLYCMQGPNGEQAWAKCTYHTIVPLSSYAGDDFFCDDQGVVNTGLPGMLWKVTFQATEEGTRVAVEITCASRADLEKVVEMGFETGFAMAHENLDGWLEAQE